MLNQYIQKPHVLYRMRNCHLSHVLDDYTDYLHERGYKRNTILRYCQSVEHFSHWISNKGFDQNELNEFHLKDFISNHLEKCHCPSPSDKDIKIVRAALQHFLLVIANKQIQKKDLDYIDKVIIEFDSYLRDICGLSNSTRFYRTRLVRNFLKKKFKLKPIQYHRLNPNDVVHFITERAYNLKSSSIGGLTSSLRSYFKFLQLNGFSVKKLLAAIPRIPNWKLTSVPTYLNKQQIDEFLSAFDRTSASGKRDYAMARCLVDLGLRCHEVAELRLEDIDWHESTLRIKRGKTKQEDILPLPKTLGEAIVDYCRYGRPRPRTKTRALFVYHRAPLGQAVCSSTVRGAIRRGYQRAGFSKISSTHILRHSLATRMLQSGAKLKDIADMLRHRCIDTTMIYTKVDFQQLTSVVMPWIGGKTHE